MPPVHKFSVALVVEGVLAGLAKTAVTSSDRAWPGALVAEVARVSVAVMIGLAALSPSGEERYLQVATERLLLCRPCVRGYFHGDHLELAHLFALQTRC